MPKKPLNKKTVANSPSPKKVKTDEAALFTRISKIIEMRKYRAAAYANQETTLMFWEVGALINSEVLKGKRAD